MDENISHFVEARLSAIEARLDLLEQTDLGAPGGPTEAETNTEEESSPPTRTARGRS